eukprot:CAMPEP_0182942876 /NCGR_PEP_ID=MMETSP0105_2-20130417/51469_1 /TAXON_ID=81532 ORGANISM="Acanthoeca-like sp., Strain 10tr" /NCGR_SAMPLE_ID=MMETSP0105_2 /ASSEMBLY_ACC=CAM_ASM_000205 /LENGTH=34 /DNA_ID= /DNA_START= /DNA_END= /DNA_ORIENTATION=
MKVRVVGHGKTLADRVVAGGSPGVTVKALVNALQ